MEIDLDMICYLEELSRLSLSDEEKLLATKELAGIIRYMDTLNKVDTSGVPSLSHPFVAVNGFRADDIVPSYERIALLKNAPEKTLEYFVAPRTVE